MLSILKKPKAFSGHVELIQTIAVDSWRRLKVRCTCTTAMFWEEGQVKATGPVTEVLDQYKAVA